MDQLRTAHAFSRLPLTFTSPPFTGQHCRRLLPHYTPFSCQAYLLYSSAGGTPATLDLTMPTLYPTSPHTATHTPPPLPPTHCRPALPHLHALPGTLRSLDVWPFTSAPARASPTSFTARTATNTPIAVPTPRQRHTVRDLSLAASHAGLSVLSPSGCGFRACAGRGEAVGAPWRYVSSGHCLPQHRYLDTGATKFSTCPYHYWHAPLPGLVGSRWSVYTRAGGATCAFTMVHASTRRGNVGQAAISHRISPPHCRSPFRRTHNRRRPLFPTQRTTTTPDTGIHGRYADATLTSSVPAVAFGTGRPT